MGRCYTPAGAPGVTSGRRRSGVSGIGRVERRRDGQGQHVARLRRVDHAVVPQARRRVVGVALALVLGQDRRLEGVPRRLAGPLPDRAASLADGRQHAGRLRATHHADARVGPRPQAAAAVGAAAHAVVAGPERAADDDRELGHLGRGGHGRDELGAVLGDAAGLVLASDHEAGDVLQEEQGDPALARQLDEVGALEGRFAEQHAVVGEDAERVAVQVGEAADERRAVLALELVELGAVDEAGDDLAHVVALAQVAPARRRRCRRGRRPVRRRRTARRCEAGSWPPAPTAARACASSGWPRSRAPRARACSSSSAS